MQELSKTYRGAEVMSMRVELNEKDYGNILTWFELLKAKEVQISTEELHTINKLTVLGKQYMEDKVKEKK